MVRVIRRYLSAALAVLVILVALVALVAQGVMERRPYDLDRSARIIDEALSDPANRDALDRARAEAERDALDRALSDPAGNGEPSRGGS